MHKGGYRMNTFVSHTRMVCLICFLSYFSAIYDFYHTYTHTPTIRLFSMSLFEFIHMKSSLFNINIHLTHSIHVMFGFCIIIIFCHVSSLFHFINVYINVMCFAGCDCDVHLICIFHTTATTNNTIIILY